eukprot:5502436-Prymnesium_polylepis.1
MFGISLILKPRHPNLFVLFVAAQIGPRLGLDGLQTCWHARRTHIAQPACAEGARGGGGACSQGGGGRAPEDCKLARRAEPEGERPLPGALPDVSPPSRRRMQVVEGRGRGSGASCSGGQPPALRHHPGWGAPVLQGVWLPVYGEPESGEKDDYESKYKREGGSWITEAYGRDHQVRRSAMLSGIMATSSATTLASSSGRGCMRMRPSLTKGLPRAV